MKSHASRQAGYYPRKVLAVILRRFITHTEHKLTQLLSQSLAALELPVLIGYLLIIGAQRSISRA